jgi:hypothetical protein
MHQEEQYKVLRRLCNYLLCVSYLLKLTTFQQQHKFHHRQHYGGVSVWTSYATSNIPCNNFERRKSR